MKKIILILIGCFLTTGAFAAPTETRGLQLSLIPDVAIHPKTTRIHGVSLGLWNENPQSGFAWGFVNGATGDSAGLLLGVLGNYAENYTGVQWSYFVNFNKGRMTGFQAGAFNYAATLNGFQFGVVNYTESTESALQVGLFNIITDNKRWFGNFPEELAPGMVFVNWRFK